MDCAKKKKKIVSLAEYFGNVVESHFHVTNKKDGNKDSKWDATDVSNDAN